MTISARRTEKSANGLAKAACLFMVCALVAFSLRFHWGAVPIEDGSGFIVRSNPPVLGLYFAGASLICGIAWLVLAIGFKARLDSEQQQMRSGPQMIAGQVSAGQAGDAERVPRDVAPRSSEIK